MISKLSSVIKICAICVTILLFSCSKEKQLNNDATEQSKLKLNRTLSDTPPTQPITVTTTVSGTKVNVTWTKPSDFVNGTNNRTRITYSSSLGASYTFEVFANGSTFSFYGNPGETYSITVSFQYYVGATTPTPEQKTVTGTASASIPSTAVPNCSSEVITAQMQFPEEIEYAGPNNTTLYKQDYQIIVRLPADYSANQLWVIRYKKRYSSDPWQYSPSIPSSGTIINGRSFNFWIFNGLDGEYEFEIGLNCSGTPTGFTNTAYASTIVI